MSNLTNFSSSSSSDDCPLSKNIYGYDPSHALDAIATVVWALLSITLLIQTLVTKKFFFLIVPIAGLFETIGYIIRFPSGNSPCNVGLYIFSYLLILVSPTCLAMGNYALVGRIIARTGHVHHFFTPKRVQYMFLFVDIFCLLLQCAGGGLMAQHSSFETGHRVVLLGIALALVLFCFFLFLVVYVNLKVRKNATEGEWLKIFIALYATIVLIIIRSIYRLVEFAGGFHNSISTNENLFYGLDSLVLAIFVALWIYYHPSRVDFEGTPGNRPATNF